MKNHQTTIREFGTANAADVTTIAEVCHASMVPSYWSHPGTVESIARRCTGVIAYRRRVPVGCLIYHEPFTLELLLVKPGYRRKGIGGILMLHAPGRLYVEIPADHRIEWLGPWLSRWCEVSVADFAI